MSIYKEFVLTTLAQTGCLDILQELHGDINQFGLRKLIEIARTEFNLFPTSLDLVVRKRECLAAKTASQSDSRSPLPSEK